MNKISKVLSVTLATSLLVAGCASNANKTDGAKGSKVGNSSPDYKLSNVAFPLKDKVALKMVTSSSVLAPKDPNEKLIFSRLEKDTNVHIDWINYASDFGDKRNLLLASGDLPDALFNAGFSDAEILKYSKDGVIVPVDDLVDKYMPNLKAIYDKHPEYKAFATSPDGKMYSFPWIEELGAGKESIHSVTDMAWINKVWLDKLGLKIPTTTDELEKVLIAFKENDPNGNGQKDEIPMSFIINNGNEGPHYLFGSFGLGDNWDHTVVTNEKKVVYTRADEGYKEAMKWMNGLQNKGLIDPEAYTQDWPTFTAKGKEKRYGLYFTWDRANVSGDNEEYVLMPPLKGPNGQQNIARANGFGLDRGRAVITSANKNLELTARWLDKMYDPVQSAQNNWGTYGDDKQQNIFEMKDGKLKHLPLNGTAPGELRDKTCVGGPLAILDTYYGNQVTKPDDAAWRLERIKELVPFMKADNVFPRVFYTTEEMDEYTKLDTLINPFTDRKTAEWISKGGVEQEWNAYLAELDKMGLKKFVEIKQKAFDNFNSKTK
jgi:putative aldouronate transport system substrate-binding protein